MDKKTTQLKKLITSKDLSFLMEVHNGLSAKIAEEAGFQGLWGSGLSISAACGVRDNNEMSWTQVLDVIEYITDATSKPLLLDGDTGYGNFNNMRRLVKKLESRHVAGVCIEDKIFPKTNSFIDGEAQPLADIDEFAGKIKAGKDAQSDDDFVIVARVEAFIAGWGLQEALKRAESYHQAGADAILIHSKISRPDEVLAFKKEWADRLPVVIVPTKYYSTPTEVFKEAGFSTVIWANHLMRTCISSMQQTSSQIFNEQSLVNVEERVVPVKEVFRLQGADELKQAEKLYLPKDKEKTSALILAASQGKGLGDLTLDKPKAMVSIAGKPLLDRILSTINGIGIKDITVVRGFQKETIAQPNVKFVDNDDFENTQEVVSLHQGLKEKEGAVLVSYGDVLYHKYIPSSLLESDADFSLVVDSDLENSQNKGRYGDFVVCEKPYDKHNFEMTSSLKEMKSGQIDKQNVHGEWMGLFKASSKGLSFLKELLTEHSKNETFSKMRMSELFNSLVSKGQKVEVIYSKGHWLDVDELKDVLKASELKGEAAL